MSNSDQSQAVERIIEGLLANNREVQKQYHAPPMFLQLRESPDVPPAVVIVTCADPRVIPEKYFNFNVGECAVIRTAGGRTFDALRSLAVLDQVLALQAVLVVHHTDCGLSHVSNHSVREGLKRNTPPESAARIDGMEFGEIAGADFEGSLKEDTKLIRESGFFGQGLVVRGYLFDLESGRVEEVCRA